MSTRIFNNSTGRHVNELMSDSNLFKGNKTEIPESLYLISLPL